jgi:hypothetical protein
MENIKVASKFVVQVARLLEVDRGGAPRFAPAQVIAAADSLDEARQMACRLRDGDDEVSILEVFSPVDVGGGSLRFIAPVRRAVVEPKAKPVRKARKAA